MPRSSLRLWILVALGIGMAANDCAQAQYTDAQGLDDMLRKNGITPLNVPMGTQKSYSQFAQEDEAKGDAARERGELSAAADYYFDSFEETYKLTLKGGDIGTFQRRVSKLASVGAYPPRQAPMPGIWWKYTRPLCFQLGQETNDAAARHLSQMIEIMFGGWQRAQGNVTGSFGQDSVQKEYQQALATRQTLTPQGQAQMEGQFWQQDNARRAQQYQNRFGRSGQVLESGQQPTVQIPQQEPINWLMASPGSGSVQRKTPLQAMIDANPGVPVQHLQKVLEAMQERQRNGQPIPQTVDLEIQR